MRRTRLAAKLAERPWPHYIWAAHIGIPPTRLSWYQRGVKEIRPEDVALICEAMGCRPEDVVGWDPDEAWDDPYEQRVRRA